MIELLFSLIISGIICGLLYWLVGQFSVIGVITIVVFVIICLCVLMYLFYLVLLSED